MPIPDVLAAARLRLSRDPKDDPLGRPYLASALWALQMREVKGMAAHAAGPIGVDPWFRLYYDPEAIATWSVEDLAAVLYHEVGHLLRDHAGRADALPVPRDAHRVVWNIAGDLEINDDIVADGMRLPKDVLLPSTMQPPLPDGLLAEEYYHRLLATAKECDGTCGGQGLHLPAQGGPAHGDRPGHGGCGSGAGGEKGAHEEDGTTGDGDTPGVNRAEAELIRQKVAEDVREHLKHRGTVPAGLRRWADARLSPKVDWRKVLASLVRRALGDVRGAVDYTHQRVSRRQAAWPEVVLPALRQPVPSVAVVVDTSGSMSERELAQALAEIDGVLLACGLKEGVTVVPCDTAVGTVKRVLSRRTVVLDGGGGTDMRVGLARALEARPKPDVVMIITDCETPWGCEQPGIPVIVASTQRGAVGVPGWAKYVEVVPDDERG